MIFRRLSSKIIIFILIAAVLVAMIALFIRSLPASSVKLNTSLAQPGYTLVAPLNAKDVYLVDNNGKAVHSWKTDNYAGAVTKLVDDGILLRTYEPDTTYFSMGGKGGGIQLIDWNGNVTWDFQYNTPESALHHDATMMPNGHILALAWVKIPREQAIEAGVNPENIDDKSDSIWSDRVIEIDPASNQIVWQWDVFDHLVQDYDDSKANYGDISKNFEKINANYYKYSKKADWIHTNSVDYNPATDQIMISAREFNEIWIIDHSTSTKEAKTSRGGRAGAGGDLLYRFGNPEVHGDVEGERELFLQHDAQWIKPGLPGAGNVLLFDNGDEKHGRTYSSAIELRLPDVDSGYQTDERGFKRPEIVWRYGAETGEESFFSSIMGGVQRLPNGNTILTDSVHGRGLEVTPDRKQAWIYESPYVSEDRLNPGKKTNNIFRIYKYQKDSHELKGRF